MSAWWDGLPPAQARVHCDGATHRLRWEAGRLTALDHADVEGERTLAALSGTPVRCLDVLSAWERHAEDLTALVLARRGPGDLRTVHAHPARFRGWTAYAPVAVALPAHPGGGPPERSEVTLETLLALGGGLPERLVAGVLAAWAPRDGGPDAAKLHAALYGRVHATVTAWLGRPDLRVEVERLGAGAPPAVSGDDEGVRIALPFGWLSDVWAREMAVVLGRLCLAAATTDGRAWTLTVVGPDLGAPETLELRLRG